VFKLGLFMARAAPNFNTKTSSQRQPRRDSHFESGEVPGYRFRHERLNQNQTNKYSHKKACRK